MTKDKKILIIGSGLGGLICGVILSRKGYKVTVLEKHHTIGGCLQTFKRKGIVFDTGMHYVGGLDDGQILNRILKYLRIWKTLRVRKLNTSGFDVINIDGKEYNYVNGLDHFRDTMIEYFPDENEGIKKYTDKVRSIVESIDLYNLREVSSAGNIFSMDHLKENAAGFIDTVTSNENLKKVLAALNPLYSGRKDNTFLYIHSIINNHYIESAYRFAGGSQQVANQLADQIRLNGCEVLIKNEVKEFVFDDDKIKAVETIDGQQYTADIFISDAHPYVTMDMIPPGKIRRSYKARLQNLKNTPSYFALYLIFKPQSLPAIHNNIYHYGYTDNVWTKPTKDLKLYPDDFAIFPGAETENDQYTKAATVFTNMDIRSFKKWENTTIEKRGEDYKQLKENIAQHILSGIRKNYPHIYKCIDTYYTSSPLTIRDYTYTKDGSIYGIERNYNNPLEAYVFPRTKVPNLLLTGQNLNLHGMLGVSFGSLMTCGELLGLNNIIKEINEETA